MLTLLRINQLEDVIEDEEAARAVREQLKHLGIIHRSLLLIDLHIFFRISHADGSSPAIPPHRRGMEDQVKILKACRTNNAPVTITSIPPDSFDGCASRVATWCTTFLNGSA